MEYICNTIEEAKIALINSKGIGDVFVCSYEVFEYLCNQPERSKREDFYLSLAKEYLVGKEHWETDASEKISIECFASWLDRRCGALNSVET